MKLSGTLWCFVITGCLAAQSLPTVPSSAVDGAAQGPLAQRLVSEYREEKARMIAEPLAEIVTVKTVVADSGDRHDYISFGPYWWPDPAKKDGLPYIRKDGQVNPDSRKADSAAKDRLWWHISKLGYAYLLTGDEAFAARGVEWLKTFFLDDATRMNPHLRYGQAIPGLCMGRSTGVVETENLINVVDAATIFRNSQAMTPEIDAGLKKWFAAYVCWLENDPMPRQESGNVHNIGIGYHLQIACFAKFAGDDATARRHLMILQSMIPRAIADDGALPSETERTRSWQYSCYTLQKILCAAAVGRDLGIDLLAPDTLCGKRIRAAVDYMAGFVKNPEAWPYQNIIPINFDAFAGILAQMAYFTGEERYLQMFRELPAGCKIDHRTEIFYLPKTFQK